jgi:hypothetical protein
LSIYDVNQYLSFAESYIKKFNRFQEQINADLGYFEPGSGLLSQAIASIRGLVEIDQAKSDRKKARREKQFTNTVTAVGTGVTSASFLTSASILSSQSSPHIKGIKKIFTGKYDLADPGRKTNDGWDSGVAICFPLIIGFLVGLVVWVHLKNGQSHPNTPR